MEMQIVWVILPHEYRCLQCGRHKHSTSHRVFVAVFRCIFWGLVLPLSHLIVHPVQEWSGFWRHFWYCFGARIHLIVFNNESVCVPCEYNGFAPFFDARCIARPNLFIISFDFAVTLSSPESSCVLFDIAMYLLKELTWLMLYKHKRWFPSSLVKFPFVSMSANWFLVSMYFCIWFGFFGSKFIRSNIQSSATLWVLETCLICENWTFEGTRSTWFKNVEQSSRLLAWRVTCVTADNGLPCSTRFWFVFPRTATIRSHKSRAGIPSNLNPASKEMISGSVELCETEVYFLHSQLLGTNVWLPKTHSVPPEVDFESSRSPAKSESWNSPSLHCLTVLPT